MRCTREQCKELFPEERREAHDKYDCQFVPVRCPHCNEEMLRGQLEVSFLVSD